MRVIANRYLLRWGLCLITAGFVAGHGAIAAPASEIDYCRQAAAPAANSTPTDRLYAAGECALHRLDYREAIRHFQRMVAINSNPVFRAELGRAYLGAQQYERATEQFLLALKSHPPKTARRLLQFFLQMAEQRRTQAKRWFASASIGEIEDSNVNSGPVSAAVELYGLPFIMNPASMPKADHGIHAAFSVVHNQVLGAHLSWLSNAAVDLVKYATYGNYDTAQIGIDTGLQFPVANGRIGVYLPFGVNRATLGGNGYSATMLFSPQANLRLDNADLLSAVVTASRIRYDGAPARDVTDGSIGLTWQRVLGQNWTIAPGLAFTTEHAADPAFSDLARTASLSFSGSLPDGLRLSTAGSITWADYRAAESWAAAARKDRRTALSLTLSKALKGGYYASLSWLQMRTRSNLGLYSTARRQVQLQLSKNF